MFVYDIVTCWDKKACFKSKICPFLGLGSGWVVLGFFLGEQCSWEKNCLRPLI